MLSLSPLFIPNGYLLSFRVSGPGAAALQRGQPSSGQEDSIATHRLLNLFSDDLFVP